MSGVLRTVGKVAGVVALVASVIPGGQPIAAVAALVAAGANIGAQITAKKPPVQGSTLQTTIGTDQPSPCLIGRTFYAGSRVQLTGYGAERKKVKNPYLFAVDVHSVAGPVDALEGVYADFALVGFAGNAATGYFSTFLYRSFQLGAVPAVSVLALQWAGAPGWGPSSQLSGKAAIGFGALFDRDGEVFASGFAPMGAVWRGVLCYDPRKDSTYPGGSGPHRWADPADTAAHDAARATWTWSECPGLHGLHYALGRWERDPRIAGSRYRKVFGVGMPFDGLRVADFIHLANTCDANAWKAGGVLLEPVSSKWDNLKRILAAGGAETAWVGGLLGVKVQAPRIALDTITADDLADGEVVVGAMQGWEQRLNTLIPKYRSEQHRWEYVATTNRVQIPTYLADDGEEKAEERRIELCQSATQAAQLCAYELMDRRELGNIELPCKPRLRRYGPGDLLIIDLPEAGLVAQPCMILKRSLDPQTMAVSFVLRSETIAKHAFALGRTGFAPPTPALGSTSDLDSVAAPVVANRSSHVLIRQSVPYPVTSDADSITVVAFDGVIDDGRQVSFPAADLSGKDAGTAYVLYWRLSTSVYVVALEPALAEASDADLVYIRSIATANSDGTYPETPTPPGGDGGNGSGGNCVTVDSLVLMSDGSWKQAEDLRAGDMLRTRHEHTLAWGDHAVEAISVHREAVWAAAHYPDTTPRHRFWIERAWVRMEAIGTDTGYLADVARITVEGAHTYVARHPRDPEDAGRLSHNVKQIGGE